MAMVRRLGFITAVARRLGSSADATRRLSTRCAPTAVIHVARPFSNTLRVPAPPPGTAKAEQAPAELAARLDDIGAQVKIRLLSRDDEMKAKALPTARVDNLTDRQALGSVEDGNEIHLCGIHDVRDAPDYLQLKRLEVTGDHESKLRRKATLRRLRSRGILISQRRAPTAVLTPAVPGSNRFNRAAAGSGEHRDSAAWIVGRLQVIAAKISRGVQAYEK